MKITLLIIIILLLNIKTSNANINGGGNTLLVFAKNETLLPSIEKSLKQLNIIETDERLFDEVIILNRYYANLSNVERFDSLRFQYNPPDSIRKYGLSRAKQNREVIEKLDGTTSYIGINVLSHFPLIEFQMYVTDTIKDLTDTTTSNFITDQSRYIGFVIDLSRSDYELQLENALRKVFPECDHPPYLSDEINSKVAKDGYYYYRFGDSVSIDLSNSFDLDDSLSQLTFHWSQIGTGPSQHGIEQNSRLPLEKNRIQQNFVPREIGEYLIEIYISNGIKETSKDTLRIRVLHPPQIVSDSIYVITTYMRNSSVSIPIKVSDGEEESALEVVGAKHTKEVNWTDILRFTRPKRLFSNITQIIEISNLEKGSDSMSSFSLSWKKRGDSRTILSLVPVSEHLTGDTVNIRVIQKDRKNNLFLGFSQSRSYALLPKNGDSTEQEISNIVRLDMGFKYNISKYIYFQYGYFLPTHIKRTNPLTNYKYPTSYFKVGVYYTSIGFEQSGIYSAWTLGTDFGKMFSDISFCIDFSHYPHWRNVSFTLGIDIPDKWTGPLYLLPYLWAWAI